MERLSFNPSRTANGNPQFHLAVVMTGLMMLGVTQMVGAKPSEDTTVYYAEGKKRVHVEDCRRYKRLSDEEQAAMVKMTLGEAEAKGLPLCSRCPGSTTHGKGNPKEEKGLESWVNPPPDEVTQVAFTPSEKAPLVSLGADGKLVYKSYSSKGDRILDWSKVGYRNSNVPIPDVKVVKTLEPLSGEAKAVDNMKYPMGPDSRDRIQVALDEVAGMEPDADGFRGAVLLKRGTYYINGSLQVGSGVVLRGEGSGEDGTVLIGIEGVESNAFVTLTGDGGIGHDQAGNAVRLAGDYVPSGSTELTLEDAEAFKKGDYVCIKKTVNPQWIDDLGMGERLRHIRGGQEGLNKKPWKPEAYQFRIIRQIENIEGNTITLNVAVPQSFDQKHGGGEVYPVDFSELGRNGGVESLRLISNYDTTVRDESKKSDFKNYRSAVVVENYANGWVRDCTSLHFSFASALTGTGTYQITVRDSKYLEPVGPKRGGNRYSFMVGGGTLHLFYNCYSEDGRHCFAGGSREQGPFAFVNCTSVRGGQSEPHHRWGTGFLYDNVSTPDGRLAAINRGDSGSGHGWAAANTLFWNGNARSIVVMDPETEGENNFAIGFTGEPGEYDTKGLMYANTRAGYWGTPQEGKYYGFALMGSGYIECPERPMEPRSLFTQQLIERIGKEEAKAVLEGTR